MTLHLESRDFKGTIRPKFVHIKVYNQKEKRIEFNQAYDMSNFFFNGELPSME
jgi:hypothetical protein